MDEDEGGWGDERESRSKVENEAAGDGDERDRELMTRFYTLFLFAPKSNPAFRWGIPRSQ